MTISVALAVERLPATDSAPISPIHDVLPPAFAYTGHWSRLSFGVKEHNQPGDWLWDLHLIPLIASHGVPGYAEFFR
jgi:hypothetical protein